MSSCKALAQLILWCLLCLSSWHDARAVVIRVNPSNGGEGIQRALNEVAELRKLGKVGAHTPARIVLEGGRYELAKPLEINPEMSGTANSPTIVEAAPGTFAVISGARPIKPYKVSQHEWRFSLPEPSSRLIERSGGQFFVDGERAILARQPDQGSYWFVKEAYAPDGTPSKEAFFGEAGDSRWLEALSESDQDRAFINVMHSWTSSSHRLRTHRSAQNIVKLEPASKWSFLVFGRSQRYWIENVKAALNAPGEWLVDGQDIRYIPSATRAPQAKTGGTHGFWPRMPTLIKIEGRSFKSVSHVVIRDITLEYTGIANITNGFIDTQAAVSIGAAIEVDRARNVVLEDCSIRHTAGYGVWFRHDVKHSKVSGCRLDDLGAGGIKVGASTLPLHDPLTQWNTLEGNVISNTGHVFPGAVGIWVGHAANNTIQRNVIAYTTYSGISVGWLWGFGDSPSFGNKIINNTLTDIGQGTLSDMGGIYTLGKSAGSIISGNLITRVTSYDGYGPGAWGIYSDEGSSDMLIKENVVIDSPSGGYHLHYGRNLRIEDNFFALFNDNDFRWSDRRRSDNITMIGNAWAGRAAKPLPRAPTLPGLSILNEWRHTSPPHIKTAKAVIDDFLNTSSAPPAAAKAWQDVIRRGDADMEAKNPKQTAEHFVQIKRREDIRRWDFADAKPGSTPAGFRLFPKSGNSPLVKSSHQGARCLMFVDGSSGLVNRFDPHMYLPVAIRSGTLRVEFSVILDDDSEFIHEWRDDATPYRTGPSLTLSSRGLFAGGKRISNLPTHQPINVSVTVDLKKPSAWTLEVIADGQKSRSWAQLPAIHEAISSFEWIGFISNGVATAHTCIKHLVIEHRQ